MKNNKKIALTPKSDLAGLLVALVKKLAADMRCSERQAAYHLAEEICREAEKLHAQLKNECRSGV